ncbi:hypothetical protein ACJ41O_010663 [Fusarium nematophilum]
MAGTSTSTSASSCPIQKIPLEVLLRITYFLTTPELGSLRLTCRPIEQALYTTFTNEFFTRKQFMVSEDSLQALIDISKSRLSPHLRFVHIGLDRFSHAQGGQHNMNKTRLLERHAGQFTIFATGHHRDMLAEAFRGLENLEDVIIRDFNSQKRTRDGFYRQWTSYGSTTAYLETGTRAGQGQGGPWTSDTHVHYGGVVFSAVLYALGLAEARPKGIVYMSRHGNHLRDFAFNIPPYLERLVVPVLEGLEKLHIDIDLIGENSGSFYSPPSPFPSAADLHLRRFLIRPKNLKHLRINGTHSSAAGPGILLSWLSQPGDPVIPSSSSPPRQGAASNIPPWVPPPIFPHLEELNFGIMNVEAPHILGACRKFAPSLKRLELWKVTLLRHLPSDRAAGPLPKISFWTKFLEQLRDIPGLDLRHIKVGFPQQQWIDRPSRSWVNFGGPTVMQYTGPDWKHFVGEMVPKVKVNFPPDEESRSGESDESDEEVEDEEDGDGDDDEDGPVNVWDQYALDL